MVSVEVLVPWDLRSVELWEEWIDEDIQNELGWQLSPEVQAEWKGDWVEAKGNGHHSVSVKGQSLITNNELIQVDKHGE